MKSWKKIVAVGSLALLLGAGHFLYDFQKRREVKACEKATGLETILYTSGSEPKKDIFMIKDGSVQDLIRNASWLGLSYNSPKEAIALLNKAQKKASRFFNIEGNPTSVIDEYKALCFNDIGMSDSASEYIQRAIKENKRIGWTSGLAENYHNLAEFYEEKKDYHHAIKYFSMSIKENEKIGYPFQIVRAYCHLSKLYGAVGNFKSAHTSLDRALFFNDKLNDNVNLIYRRHISQRMESICRQLGNVDEANEWHEKYNELDKEIERSGIKGDFKKY